MRRGAFRATLMVFLALHHLSNSPRIPLDPTQNRSSVGASVAVVGTVVALARDLGQIFAITARARTD